MMRACSRAVYRAPVRCRLYAASGGGRPPTAAHVGIAGAGCVGISVAAWYYYDTHYAIDRFLREDNVKQALVQALQSGNVIANVGTGFSRLAPLPDFVSFLAEVAYHCRVRIDEEKLEDASPEELVQLQWLIAHEAGKQKIVAAIREVLQVDAEGAEAMAGRVGALMALPLAAIVTDNWDEILDARCDVLRLTAEKPYEQLVRSSARGGSRKTPLIKLRGSLHSMESVCVSRKDEEITAGMREEFQKRLFAESHVLHVGLRCASGDNPQRQKILDHSISPRHFALLPAFEVDDDRKRDLLHNDDTAVLTFESAEPGNDGLESILRDLQSRLA